MTSAFVIYVLIASTLASTLSIYVATQLYSDLEKMKKADQIRRNVEKTRLEIFSA